MRKTWLVAVREYQAAVKSKSFVITLLAMPLLMGGGIVAQFVLKDRVDIRDRRVAILDPTGQLSQAVQQAAAAYNATGVYSDDSGTPKQVKPKFVVELVDASQVGSPPGSTLKLSERVRTQELFAFVEVGPDALTPGATGSSARFAYHSNSPNSRELHNWLTAVLNQTVQRIRSQRAGIDPETILSVTQPVRIENLSLVVQSETGEITEAEEVNRAANILVPMGLMMLMFLGIMIGATPLVQTVLEEKMGRISEVLLGSIPPFELMLGKLIGTVGVSVTLVSFYLLGAYCALSYAGHTDYFPSASLLTWALVYLVLAVLMFGAMFSAIGAAVSDMKEAQSTMMPVMCVVMAPMFVWVYIVKEPNSSLSVLMSLFPPATPMLMVLRQSVPPGVPPWQPIVGIVLVLLTTLVCIFCASRIFRMGVLMQGKGASYWQMLRWVLRG